MAYNSVEDNKTTLLAFSPADPKRLMVGVPDIYSPSFVLEYMGTVLPDVASFGWNDKLLSLNESHVEFIPFCATQNTDSYDTWAENEAKNGANPSRLRFLRHSQTQNAEPLDKTWEESKLGWTVYTGALLLTLCSEDGGYVPSSNIQHQFLLHDSAVSALQDTLGEKFGKDNVFVSKQLIPAEQFCEEFREFFSQAHARLVEGERYWRHVYDTQLHPAGKMYLPLYAVPVSILKRWGRVISYSEYNEFVGEICKPIMDRSQLNQLVSDNVRIDAMVFSTSVCPVGVANKLIENYKYVATRTIEGDMRREDKSVQPFGRMKRLFCAIVRRAQQLCNGR